MAEELSGLNIHLIFVGRLNPPTVNGHLKVIKQMINKANSLIGNEEQNKGIETIKSMTLVNNYKITIYLTMTQNNKTDPLKPIEKKLYLDKLIKRLNENDENPKNIEINVEINPNCNNPLKALQCAYKFNGKLSNEIYYFLGKDREDLFYVSRKYFYEKYPDTSIEIYPEIQDRDLDEGVSASKIRSYVINNDDSSLYYEYQNYLTIEEIQELKNLVRKGLGLPNISFTAPIESDVAVSVSRQDDIPIVPLRRSARIANRGGTRKNKKTKKRKNKKHINRKLKTKKHKKTKNI